MICKWKICIMGDPSVGKTSLVRHYSEGYFRENYLSTIGVSFLRKEIQLEYKQEKYEITFQLWDLGGQAIFSNVRQTYIKGSSGALILFDLTEKSTLSHVTNWYEDLKRTENIEEEGEIITIVVGNKSDLPYNPKIIDRAKKLCARLGVDFYTTSAKTGENMNEIFEQLAKKIIDNFDKLMKNNKSS